MCPLAIPGLTAPLFLPGVFLIPYFLMLLLVGLPLFLMELSLGQYGAAGPITVWKCCPILQGRPSTKGASPHTPLSSQPLRGRHGAAPLPGAGVGVGMMVVSSLVSIYYNVIIAWAFYYLGSSFQSPLPWSCDAPRNAELCKVGGPEQEWDGDPGTGIPQGQALPAAGEGAADQAGAGAREGWRRLMMMVVMMGGVVMVVEMVVVMVVGVVMMVMVLIVVVVVMMMMGVAVVMMMVMLLMVVVVMVMMMVVVGVMIVVMVVMLMTVVMMMMVVVKMLMVVVVMMMVVMLLMVVLEVMMLMVVMVMMRVVQGKAGCCGEGHGLVVAIGNR